MKKSVYGLDKLLVGTCAAFLVAANASAVPTAYTDRAAFDAAVAAALVLNPTMGRDDIDFESPPAPAIFPTTTSHQGVTFSYNLGGYELGVDDAHAGTSGLQTLRVSNDNGLNFASFLLGDVINFSFAASHAFGMYIIVPTVGFDFFAEDVNLTFGGTTLSNLGTDVATLVGTNNVAALFVGIVDSTTAYTSANLRFGPVGVTPGAAFEIDDIVKTSPVTSGGPGGSVPEPGMLALLGVGMLGLALARRKAA